MRCEANIWRARFFRTLGLPATPQVPYYFSHCPACGKGPVRIAEDPLFIDGWCGCENCAYGVKPVQFLADYFDIPLEQVFEHYAGSTIARRLKGKLATLTRAAQIKKFYKNITPYSEYSCYLAPLHLPCITNYAWATRVDAHIGVFSTHYQLLRSLPNKIKFRGNSLQRTKQTTDNEDFVLCVKCTDLIGRNSGVFVWNRRDTIGHVTLTSRILVPDYLADIIGFLFGEALWQARSIPSISPNVMFVLPPRLAIRWQINQLRDSEYLLPVVATHYVETPNKQLTRFYTHKRDWLWQTWRDKCFVFWVEKLDNYTKHCIKASNGRYYVGDIPASLRDRVNSTKLKYILKRSTQYEGEWDGEDFD